MNVYKCFKCGWEWQDSSFKAGVLADGCPKCKSNLVERIAKNLDVYIRMGVAKSPELEEIAKALNLEYASDENGFEGWDYFYQDETGAKFAIGQGAEMLAAIEAIIAKRERALLERILNTMPTPELDCAYHPFIRQGYADYYRVAQLHIESELAQLPKPPEEDKS